GMFEMMEDKIKASADFEEKFNVASNTITSMETELDELRQFKAAADEAVAKNERDEVFAQFEDLIGIEAFEALKENCAEYSLEDIEEKCFAIRGRQQVPAKFALENTNTRIKVDPKQSINEEEPYGGLFVKYAIG
ncbi:MAG: hypothetical protein MJ236_02555, partial [Clostridia bacterium]|nr:hypothetical protein [Clostridia bacterium]